MNYPLSDSIKDYFLRGIKKTNQFIYEINGQSMYYKQQISDVMFNLLDSHDTERILWTANEDVQLVKSALAFLFLQKGTTVYLLRNRVILNWRTRPRLSSLYALGTSIK